VVYFEGVAHSMNVAVIRLALVHRQVEGRYHRRAELAKAAGCSQSTVSRFISGRSISLAVTLKILAKLNVTFDAVFTRCIQDEVNGPTDRA
jgi:transcriptional regulator with XRE-family HTH domain